MELIDRFLIAMLLSIMFVGCAPKAKKESVNTPKTSTLKKLERVRPPVMMTNPRDQAGYIITHFWDKFDFRDTMYCHADHITEQAFVDFIYYFPMATSNKIAEAVKKLLDSAEVEVLMYNYFQKIADKYLYNPNSVIRNDEFFIPFLEHIVASQSIQEEFKIRPRLLLQMAYRNRPGTKAANIVYTLASGRTGQLFPRRSH